MELDLCLRPPRAVITLTGEMDLAANLVVVDALNDAMRAECFDVELDLGAVTFADSAAITGIRVAAMVMQGAGGGLTIARLSGPVTRVAELMDADDVLRKLHGVVLDLV